MIKYINTKKVPLLRWDDLTKEEQEQFSYLEENEKRICDYMRYQDDVLCSDMFETTGPNMYTQGPRKLQEAGWHVYHVDTYFSAIVGKFKEESIILSTIFHMTYCVG